MTPTLSETKKLVYSHMGKRSLETMTKKQRLARARKAGLASAAARKHANQNKV